MAKKPVVFVTRKLPEAVHERLRRDHEPRLNLSDRLYSGEELARVSEGADALLPAPPISYRGRDPTAARLD